MPKNDFEQVKHGTGDKLTMRMIGAAFLVQAVADALSSVIQ